MYSRNVTASRRGHATSWANIQALNPQSSCPPRFPFVFARVRGSVCSSCTQLASILRAHSSSWYAYYRLGKNRPCSGILSRYSRLALAMKATPTIPVRTRPMTAVLPFQLAGCAYQPPAGDQTCFGYLTRSVWCHVNHWRRVRTGSCLLRPWLRMYVRDRGGVVRRACREVAHEVWS